MSTLTLYDRQASQELLVQFQLLSEKFTTLVSSVGSMTLCLNATACSCYGLAVAEPFILWYTAHKPSTEKMRLKVAVPLKSEVPAMGLYSNKNFVTANAIDTILAKPKQLPEDFRCAVFFSGFS